MIIILTGVPGAGKTYYAVKQIRELLHDENNLVVTNISGLKISVDNLVYVSELGTDWFYYPYQEQYISKLRDGSEKKIYYFIDEAQRFLPYELKNTEIIYFFDYHRHFGMDIYLITHHEKKICPKIAVLSEFEIRAASQSLNPFSAFIYRHRQGGETFKTERVKREVEVFDLYTSYVAGPKESKRKNPLLKWILLFFVLGIASFFWLFKSLGNPNIPGTDQQEAVISRPDVVLESRPAASSPPPRAKTFDLADYAVSGAAQYDSVQEVAAWENQYPLPLSYNPLLDSVVWVQGETEVHTKVAYYIEQFKKFAYQLRYFHSSNQTFVIFSPEGERLFPLDREYHISSQTDLPLHPAASPASSPAASPADVLTVSSSPGGSSHVTAYGYTQSEFDEIQRLKDKHGYHWEPQKQGFIEVPGRSKSKWHVEVRTIY